jgi:hypothetical protein
VTAAAYFAIDFPPFAPYLVVAISACLPRSNGWKHIPCVVVKLKSVLAGEYAENEIRKQFTPSERAAIGKAVEAELAQTERRGNPQLRANAGNSERGESRDIAAHRAGFKSAETFERAKLVTEKGTAELQAAMDSPVTSRVKLPPLNRVVVTSHAPRESHAADAGRCRLADAFGAAAGGGD